MNFKRILVLVMTFAMLLSTFAPTLGVFAEELNNGHNYESKDELVYVSLGDSMTNGYGLDGYDAEAGVYDYGYDSYANNFAKMLENKYGVNVKHHQLALSAARPEDINFLLNLDYDNPEVSALLDKYPSDDLVCWSCGDHSGVPYEDIVYCAVCKWDHIDLPGFGVQRDDGKSVDDYEAWWTLVQGEKWANLIGAGDFWTWKELVEDYRFGTVATYIKYNYGTDAEKARAEQLMAERPAKPRDDSSNGEETCYVAKHYQEAVKNADVISLAIGNGNFGVWLMGRITTVLMDYDGVAANGVYDLQKVLDTCSPEFKEQINKLLVEIDPMIDEYVTTMMGDGLEADIQKSIKDVCTYGVVSFVVNYRHVVDSILELNPDVEIVLTGLMNTYAGDSVNAPEGVVTIGDILDKMFPLLNAFIVGLPTYMQHTENDLYKDAKFYYAEEYTIECLIQNFGDEDFYNWVGVSRDRFVTGLVGECDCGGGHNTDNAEACGDWDYGIFWELLDGFNMGGITIERITPYDIKMYEAFNNEERVAFAVANKDKAGSIAVYLAIEDAVCKSGRLAPVTLSTLTGLELGNPAILNKALSNFTTEQEKIIGDYYDDAIAGLKALGVTEPTETQRNDISMILSLPVALSNALWTDQELCSMLAVVARNKLGNGLGAHPSVNGHKNLSDAMTEAYEGDGIPASVVIEKFYDVYKFAGEYGLLDKLPEISVVEEVYAYLDTNEYITDEQSLSILWYTYDCISDKDISDADTQNLVKYTYETLVRNPLLSATDRVEIVGNVYFILKANNYLNEYKALEVVEEIYEALDAEGLISDEQSYAIVDYVYETVIDGEVSGTDLLNVVKFIYETLVKGQPVVAVYARRAAAEGNEASAKTIRIVLGVLAENYLSEENKASLETLVTGNEALINDALLVEIVDNIIVEVENSETNDQAVVLENVANTAIQTVLNDENTSAETKTAIVGEIKNVADNNEILDNETSEVVNEATYLANKIYENLYAEGLMNAEQKEEIIDTLIEKIVLHLLAGNEFTTDNLVELVVDMGDIIFGREDMTVEQKVDILVVVYETLDEEGYITEENAKFIAGIVLEYYDEAYFEAYKYLDENGYIDVAVIGIEKAIEAIYVAIEEVEGGLLGTTDELTAELVKELYATIETLKELIEVLANDSAKDVNGLVAAVLELEDDLYTHLNNIYAILRQAGIDVNQLVLLPALKEAIYILETEVIPAVKAAVEAFVEVAVEYVQEKVEYYYGVAYDYIVEVLVKIQLYAQEKLHNAIAPILNAYERLVEYYEEIYGTVEEAVRVANAVFAKLFELNEKLHGKLTEAIEEVVELFVTMYEIYGNVEDALVALNTALMNIAERVDEVIGEVIAAYNALVKTLVEIYGKVEDVIDTANGIYNNVIETLEKVNGDIENTIKNAINLYNAIIKTLANTYDNIENIIIVAGQIFGYVADFLNETLNPEELANILRGLVEIIIEAYGETKDAYYVASQIYAYFAELNLDAHKDIINGALQGNYELTDDSMYVALGNALYAKELAEMLNLKDKFFQFGLEEDYAEKVAGADLITIKLDNGEAYEFALRQLTSIIDPSVEAVELEWDKYLDAEGQRALESVLAALKADLVANGVASKILAEGNGVGLTEEFVAEMVAFVVENTLYAYAEFVGRLTTVLENVRTIAPEATVVLTGIENPLAGFEFSFAEFDFDLGKYAVAVDGVVGALNAQLFAAALVNENTIFVNSNEAADIYDALNVYCDHVYDNCEDTDCNRCGAERKAPGHNYGDWEILKQPTIEEHGRKQRVCKDCGHIEFALIDKLPPVEPTHKCESKCPVCGKCMDKACTSDVCKDKCPGHDPIGPGDNGRTLVIVIVCVVVAAGAGAAVYFFVIKKKRA